MFIKNNAVHKKNDVLFFLTCVKKPIIPNKVPRGVYSFENIFQKRPAFFTSENALSVSLKKVDESFMSETWFTNLKNVSGLPQSKVGLVIDLIGKKRNTENPIRKNSDTIKLVKITLFDFLNSTIKKNRIKMGKKIDIPPCTPVLNPYKNAANKIK